MIKPVWCGTCVKHPHVDHFNCSECGCYLGSILEAAGHRVGSIGRVYWKYCPNCSKPLYSEKEMLITDNSRLCYLGE